MEDRYIPVDELATKKRGSFGSYFKGLLVGGLIGAGIAMLATPRSGEENRWMLRAKGEEIKGKALDAAEQARMHAEEMTRMGAERANDMKERGQSFIDTQKSNLLSAVEGVKEGVRTYKESSQEDVMGESQFDIVTRPVAPVPPSDLTTSSNL